MSLSKDWKLVPTTLTDSMVDAFRRYWTHTQNIYGAWTQMLAAAPVATAKKSEQLEALEWAVERAQVASLGKPLEGPEDRRWKILSDMLRHRQQADDPPIAYFYYEDGEFIRMYDTKEEVEAAHEKFGGDWEPVYRHRQYWTKEQVAAVREDGKRLHAKVKQPTLLDEPESQTKITDDLLVQLFYAAQGDITRFRLKARELLEDLE